MNILCATDERFGVNSYVIREGGHCILIDPVISDELLRCIADSAIDFAILTHEHYDHISGVNELKRRYKSIVLCGKEAEARLNNPTQNLSRFQDSIVQVIPFGNGQTSSEDYICFADETVEDWQEIAWRGHRLFFKETPGHSVGSIAILLDGEALFSGDTVFKEYPTATRLPGGSTKQFRQITETWLNSLNQELRVYPGHADSFLLKERYRT